MMFDSEKTHGDIWYIDLIQQNKSFQQNFFPKI